VGWPAGVVDRQVRQALFTWRGEIRAEFAHRLGLGLGLEFAVDAVDVGADGVDTQPQVGRDFLVTLAGGQHAQYLLLPQG